MTRHWPRLTRSSLTRAALFSAALMGVALCCVACDVITLGVEPTVEPAFKGWELYSWQEGGAWHYGLLPGTNRIKTWDEVTAAATAQGGTQAHIETQLTRLPRGEQVFWVSGQFPRTSFPDQSVVQRLAKLCLERGVALHIVVANPQAP